MKENLKRDSMAEAAMDSSKNMGVNKVSTDVASLLASIAEFEFRQRRRLEYEERMRKKVELFNMSIEEIECWENQGWVFTEIGTIESASHHQGLQERISEDKVKMRIRIMRATQKLTERILDIGVKCKVYFQIYDDESVSLLINPKVEGVVPELYKYGKCHGYVVYSLPAECSREDFRRSKVYDFTKGIMEDVSSVFEDFKLVNDHFEVDNIDLNNYDEEGNLIKSKWSFDDLQF